MNELLAPRPSIDPRLFSVLILVDGVRDDAEVLRLAQAANLPVDALEILFHGGFIDKKFKGSAAPAGPQVAAPAPSPQPAAPAAPPAPQAADGARKLDGFNRLYTYLVQETKRLLGLRGFLYQLRIERATTLLELKSLIEPLTLAIDKKHGYQAADKFMRESERLAVAAIAERDL